jgi:hypothetical protein
VDFSGTQRETDSLLHGTQLSLKAARQYRDNYRGSPRELRLLDNWIRAYEFKESAAHTGRVTKAVAEVRARRESIGADVEALKALADEITADVKAGRLSPSEGRKELGKCSTVYRQLQAREQQCAHDEEMASALADEDPADWQERMVAKYPALRESLPVLSPADLDIPV